MTVTQIKKRQQVLKDAGFYTGVVDGDWGPLSRAAEEAYNASQSTETSKGGGLDIAWSKKVSPAFVARVKQMAAQLRLPAATGPDDLMACMAWESGESFSPSIKNGAGSGATGLIQFMPSTAKGLKTSTAALARMTAEEQLEYVYEYFRPYTGKLKNLGDLYMAILWPAGVGRADSYVLWEQGARPTTYRQNIGLDVNKDGKITRAECLAKVNEKRVKGLLASNRRKL